MTKIQLDQIREMFSTNPLTSQKVEGTLPAPAFSADSTQSTLGLNFDIYEAIENDSKLLSIYQNAYNKYSNMEVNK